MTQKLAQATTSNSPTKGAVKMKSKLMYILTPVLSGAAVVLLAIIGITDVFTPVLTILLGAVSVIFVVTLILVIAQIRKDKNNIKY